MPKSTHSLKTEELRLMGNKGFTKEDAIRIQSAEDKSGLHPEFKAYVQSKTDKEK